jgi:hypothetical protein
MSSNEHIYHAAFNVAKDRGPNMAKTWQKHDKTKKKRKLPLGSREGHPKLFA